MGIIPEDNLEKDSIPFLLVRLSKIANNPTHHNAADASKLHEEGSSLQQTHPQSPTERQEMEAQVLAWKKRVKLFLRQNENSINHTF
jgi:hypothetical protein